MAARPRQKTPFQRFVRACGRLDRLGPPREMTEIVVSPPEGDTPIPALRADLFDIVADELLPALRDLDRTIPLERDRDAGVWESLVFIVGDGHAWLMVRNELGAREDVTTWGIHPAFEGVIENWSECRLDDRSPGTTSWDEARRERRVVDYGGPTLIDRGANRIIDLVTSAGGTTVASCEGHPGGAYLLWEGCPEAADVLTALGWRVEDRGGRSAAYMTEVKSIEDRNARWRLACAELEQRLAPARGARPG